MDANAKPACDVAYLILSHKHPHQVARLVNRLLRNNPRARVVVHHDYARSHLDRASFDNARVDVIQYVQGIEWGTYDQLDAILNSLRWIDERLDYRWVVFISGQDYPLCPPTAIQDFLLGSDYDAFIERPRAIDYRFREASGLRDFWSARYFYSYYSLPKVLRRFPPRVATFLRNAIVLLRSVQPWIFFWMMPRGGRTRIGVKRRRHPFREGFRCYCGSDSSTWSRKGVRAVLDFADRRPDVLAYYRRVIHPSESFFNSILMNAAGLKIHFDNLRYDRFSSPQAGHPDVLRLGDLDVLLTSGKHFARKFDAEIDNAILDELDRHIELRSVRGPSSARAEDGGAALVP